MPQLQGRPTQLPPDKWCALLYSFSLLLNRYERGGVLATPATDEPGAYSNNATVARNPPVSRLIIFATDCKTVQFQALTSPCLSRSVQGNRIALPGPLTYALGTRKTPKSHVPFRASGL